VVARRYFHVHAEERVNGVHRAVDGILDGKDDVLGQVGELAGEGEIRGAIGSTFGRSSGMRRMWMFSPGTSASLIRKAAAAMLAMPPPTIHTFAVLGSAVTLGPSIALSRLG
jgi:hypothetical protein